MKGWTPRHARCASRLRLAGSSDRALRRAPGLHLGRVGRPGPGPPGGPFARFDLPDDWEARFWADPDVKALLALDAEALAELVPVQAGVRFCRCPGCDASEADDPLVLVARQAGGRDLPALRDQRPQRQIPRQGRPSRPRPRRRSRKRPSRSSRGSSITTRITRSIPRRSSTPTNGSTSPPSAITRCATFLAKAALYAAVRHHEQPAGRKDPALARLACVLLLRFAQVYPAYATHYDQPGQPKYFQPADLPPPYRRGYRTAKWEWTASLDVPLNLVIAYALVRDDPALAEAGRQLKEANPSRTIERDLFRASAEFVRRQPEEFSEVSLQAYRGLLAVGRLLDDPGLDPRGTGADGRVRRAGVLPRWLLAAGRIDGPPPGPRPDRRVARPPAGRHRRRSSRTRPPAPRCWHWRGPPDPRR